MASEAAHANIAPTASTDSFSLGFSEAPVVAAGAPMDRFPQGSRLMRMAPVTSASAISAASNFFAAADPNISFDATRILFSGQKKKGGDWQIWEVGVDGANLRQITHCVVGCLQPVYLPRNQIAYTSLLGNGRQFESAVYVCQEDGTSAHPITFGPGEYEVETVLRNGRLLLSANLTSQSEKSIAPAANAIARSAKPAVSSADSVTAKTVLLAGGAGRRHRALYTIRPDGSGLALLRQDAAANVVPASADELADGSIVFLEQKSIERKDFAGDALEGELHWLLPGALRSSVIAQRPLVYGRAQELRKGTLLVAEREAGPAASARGFGLYSFDPASKTRGNLLYQNPNASSVQAVVLRPHAPPAYYWSILHPDVKTGRILCLNSYVSQDALGGRLAGRIAQVRVIALDQSSKRERVLGEAPVETDGSFFATVPADMPIRFELLGAKGEVVHAQRSWIWAGTGEDRGCLGCHESNALAPENHWPLALRRSDTPTSLSPSTDVRTQHGQGAQ
ncbi:MAG: HzsA-related protein [Acidobacteriaceae bacterium]